MDYRADRMRELIVRTFYECLEKEDFSTLTVGKLTQTAKINRSTFYRYYADKYALRDEVVDRVISDFAEHMEVDFLHMDVRAQEHTRHLEKDLQRLYENKRIYEILWNQQLLGRNVFEEMLDAGTHKVEMEILKQPSIADSRKQYADWYARLLVNNFLVTVRWWFLRKDTIPASQVTMMMNRHMTMGTIPTLKED